MKFDEFIYHYGIDAWLVGMVNVANSDQGEKRGLMASKVKLEGASDKKSG